MAGEKATIPSKVSQPSSSAPLLPLFFLAFVLQALLLLNLDQIRALWRGNNESAVNLSENSPLYDCESHHYTSEIISLDPLVIYLRNFTYGQEIDGLLNAGEPYFSPSQIYLSGQKTPTTARTSSSAGLPIDSPYVTCVLSRARSFMGTMLLPPPLSEFGVPQLVRYKEGERFDEHHDWYESPQLMSDGSGRRFNRVASFFVFLEDNCTKGETHFPYIDTVEGSFLPPWSESVKVKRDYRRHRKGGIAFKPVAGNAIFWVNLFANGTGDPRTVHAGLAVGEGKKTAMNIWPRKFY